jgi:nitrogen fixation protein FixH
VRTVKGRAEGSRGAECERPCDDCGAGLLRAGDVLVPSGRNDGLAVAVAAALGGTKQWTTISRVATILKSDTTPWGRSSREVEVRMVVAAVIPPTETLKRRPAHKLMWCALGGMLLIIAVVVFVQVVMWMRMSSSQHAGQRLSSSDKASDLLPLCAASLANEDACRHLSGPARTACEHSCSCNPGYSGRAGEGCTKCVQGRYSAAARDTVAPPECTPCPTHASTRSNGATSLSMCACNPGYMVNLTTGMVGDLSPCTPCPSGMFSKGSSWSGLLSNEDFAAGVTFKKQCAACPAHSSTGGRIGTPSAVRQCIHIRGREATKRTCF